MTSELMVTEHIEGDECKFAVWTGRAPTSDTRIVLRANSLESKQLWVKKLREVFQETYFSLSMPKSPAKKSSSQRSSRDLEECASLDDSAENLDKNSLASFGSTNTTDSDKVGLPRDNFQLLSRTNRPNVHGSIIRESYWPLSEEMFVAVSSARACLVEFSNSTFVLRIYKQLETSEGRVVLIADYTGTSSLNCNSQVSTLYG